MTKIEQQQTRIMAAINSQGWFTAELYIDAANQLRANGLIKLDQKRRATGGSNWIWVKA